MIFYLFHPFRNEYSQSYQYLNIWDAEKMQGCHCDYPYFGYDCSQRECPKGDDPLTTNQVSLYFDLYFYLIKFKLY